ncbi:MAG: hypothetical protein WD673_14065 [Alphaproteobacteria bacterium]
MTWDTLRAWLVGLIGLALLAGLLFVGFVALLVLVPIGIVVFLLVRHRLRQRVGDIHTRTFTWTSEGAARRSGDVEGVVIDVTVEASDSVTGSRRRPLDPARAE